MLVVVFAKTIAAQQQVQSATLMFTVVRASKADIGDLPHA
jgi:hypothetical protein